MGTHPDSNNSLAILETSVDRGYTSSRLTGVSRVHGQGAGAGGARVRFGSVSDGGDRTDAPAGVTVRNIQSLQEEMTGETRCCCFKWKSSGTGN